MGQIMFETTGEWRPHKEGQIAVVEMYLKVIVTVANKVA